MVGKGGLGFSDGRKRGLAGGAEDDAGIAAENDVLAFFAGGDFLFGEVNGKPDDGSGLGFAAWIYGKAR